MLTKEQVKKATKFKPRQYKNYCPKCKSKALSLAYREYQGGRYSNHTVFLFKCEGCAMERRDRFEGLVFADEVYK